MLSQRNAVHLLENHRKWWLLTQESKASLLGSVSVRLHRNEYLYVLSSSSSLFSVLISDSQRCIIELISSMK